MPRVYGQPVRAVVRQGEREIVLERNEPAPFVTASEYGFARRVRTYVYVREANGGEVLAGIEGDGLRRAVGGKGDVR